MDYKDIVHTLIKEWRLFTFFVCVIILYIYYTSTFDFFSKKGIKYMKPTIFVGNLGPRLKAAISIHEFQVQIYEYFKGDLCGGIFEGRKPVLYLFDPDIIKDVAIQHFDHFIDRNTINRHEQYFSRSLLNLQGSEWKGVRSTLSPAFSSAKLKNMLPLIAHCSQQMITFLKQYNGKDIEMKDALGHFTLEVIGACAFGIECEALTNENSHFVKVAEKFTYMSKLKRVGIFIILMFMPKLFRVLNISFLHRETIEELVRMLKATKAERRASGCKRNDFLQILVDAADKEMSNPDHTSKIYFDDETIDAQSLLFLLGGYETTSTLLSFAVHQMAINPDLQIKLRSHITEIGIESDVSYEQLSELTYLEAFLYEILRMYPPLSRIDRICTKKYNLPKTSVQVAVGETVIIPIYALHMDPNYYPKPSEFRPERFLGDEKSNRPSHLFLGFGTGPRNCIGQRFAMISAKMAMVTLLKNFEFSICDQTQDPIMFDKRSVLLKAEKGVWVHIEKL
uniref:unspecific monooxygenase n=1 Tax=Zygaena filipendulae TaxID=287375 RepID=A0A286MXP0_9NEOP|nr:cytochrome P450 CYP354A13 [Zygaena filipendulae]